MTLTYGSLFSGIGGLDLAVEEVFGARPLFHCEVDPNASKVLATHWPGIPNLGDITEVAWNEVPRPDILCGGFPCQDISSAGKRAGIEEGTRSGLWFRYADAIRILRPRLVVVENVGALLVRGLDIVLGSLAEIGYDARWTCLRASDVGAPHRRERLFLIASPADSNLQGLQGQEPAGRHLVPARDWRDGPANLGEPAPDPALPERRGPQQQGLGTPPGPAPEPGERSSPAPHSDSGGLQERPKLNGEPHEDPTDRDSRGGHPDGHPGPTDWGPYRAAIERWELVTRPAPTPVVDGRLSPWFTEWMMGYPHGWVASILPRNPALKACGNGVVTQQATEALRRLLAMEFTPGDDGETITYRRP